MVLRFLTVLQLDSLGIQQLVGLCSLDDGEQPVLRVHRAVFEHQIPIAVEVPKIDILSVEKASATYDDIG
jgi:hypothetical protein